MKKIIAVILILCCLFLSACQIGPSEGGENTDPPVTDNGTGGGSQDTGGGSQDTGSGENNGSDENGTSGGSADWLHTHTDANSDVYCDTCRVYLRATVDLFAINDLHGKLFDTDDNVGANELTTYLAEKTSENKNSVILSSGDMWQGTYESNLTMGAMMCEWMNEIGCVSMTLGNHEFDWGTEKIEANVSVADFPFLAINVYGRDSNKRVPYCEPSVVVPLEGFEVGIIGAIGDCYSSVSPDKVEDVYFKTGKELTALVMAESERLRSLGVDIIIYSLHDGLGRSYDSVHTVTNSELSPYYDAALSGGYVDLVFEAHSHKSYTLLDRYGVYHLQGGGEGSGISHAQLSYDLLTGDREATLCEIVRDYEYSQYESSDLISELAERYRDKIALGEKYLGTNNTYRSGDFLRSTVAGLYAKVGEEFFSEYNVVLGGGYLSVRSPYSLDTGDVYYKDIYSIFPFDNDLVLCSILGSDLLSRFINTTSSDYFVGYTEYGKSIKDVIDESATYYIVVDTYSAYYAPNRLTPVKFYTSGIYARDLLADHIYEGGFGKGGEGGPTEPDTEKLGFTYPITPISEVIEAGKSLPVNGVSTELYYVLGKVTSIVNTTYGNMYIEDADGNSIYVYGVNDSTGKIRFEYLTFRPEVGDTVLLCASVKNYDNKGTQLIELTSASMLLYAESISIAEAHELGSALSPNAVTDEKYIIYATVKEITNSKYGNLIIEDASGNTMVVYGTVSCDGANNYSALTDKLSVGDTVIFYSDIMRYVNEQGTKDYAELKDGWLIYTDSKE